MDPVKFRNQFDGFVVVGALWALFVGAVSLTVLGFLGYVIVAVLRHNGVAI